MFIVHLDARNTPPFSGATMHMLTRHADLAITIAFVIGQMSVLVPLLLFRWQDRPAMLPNERASS